MADEKDIRIGIKTTADTAGAEKAKEALEGVADAAEKAADASQQAATGSRDPTLNPMTDGSQLAAGQQQQAEAVEETTAAIEQQAEALEDLGEASDEVADSTKNLNETADAPNGFQKLFSQQRLIEIGRQLGELARVAGDFAQEFAKTEQGKKALEGLSEEAKLLGGTVASTAAGIASGFAMGGPVGGAIGGITALVKGLGDEWLDSSRRIEAAEMDLARATSEHNERMREKQRIAVDKAIELQYQEELDQIGDQNEALKEQADLLRSRRDLADAEFGLQQSQARSAGKSDDELAIERIQRNLQQEEDAARRQILERRDERTRIGQEIDANRQKAAGLAANRGTQDNPEYDSAMKAAAAGQEELSDADRRDKVADEITSNRIEAARKRAAEALTDIATRAREREERDTERRQQEADREEKRKADEAARAEEERGRLGLRGEGFADRAAGLAVDIGPQASQTFQAIGDRIAADPTAQAMSELSDALGKLLPAFEGNDERKSIALRKLQDDVSRLKAAIVKLKTPGG